MEKTEFLNKAKELLVQFKVLIAEYEKEETIEMYSFDELIDNILTLNPFNKRKKIISKPRGLAAKILKEDLRVDSKTSFTQKEVDEISNKFLETVNIYKGR